jgi:hypothetical protein
MSIERDWVVLVEESWCLFVVRYGVDAEEMEGSRQSRRKGGLRVVIARKCFDSSSGGSQ